MWPASRHRSHRWTLVNGSKRRSTTVNGGAPPSTTVGPSPDHHRTTGQRWLTAVNRRVNGAIWHSTSACRSQISPRGSATSAEWVPQAYAAATSAVDVAWGINPHARIELETLWLWVKDATN
ncbi:hypothetical protein Tco_1065745 [Tanacetum coccineum]